VLALEMLSNGEPYREVEEATGLRWEALAGLQGEARRGIGEAQAAIG
jgi:hypothetical protein